MSIQNRQTNIELLRIICIMGIIIMHFNSPDMSGGFDSVNVFSVKSVILHAMESLFVIGVDVFILISGYFLCNKNRVSLAKPIMLLIQVIVFRVGSSLAGVLIAGSPKRNILIGFLPVNYFVILYVVMYIISPYINGMIENIGKKSFKQLIIVSFMLFSVFPTLVNIISYLLDDELNGLSTIGLLGNQSGYNIVNFLLLYIVGAYINIIIDIASKRKKQIVLCALFSFFVIFSWSYLGDLKNITTSALNYDNPFVIILAVCIFLLFNSINVKENKIINSLARGAFGVYLLHISFMVYIRAEWITKNNSVIMVILILLMASIIYLVCWCIDRVYMFIYKYTIKRFVDRIGGVELSFDN